MFYVIRAKSLDLFFYCLIWFYTLQGDYATVPDICVENKFRKRRADR
jgi:hypothetical protein